MNQVEKLSKLIMEKKKILIVEDEIIIAMNMQNMLEEKGYDVIGIYSTGEEVLEKINEEIPDIIIMDVVLSSKIDGITAYERIKKEYDIPIIYQTAYNDEETIRRVITTEPYGYIMKPVKENELYSAIEIALYKYEMERKLRESEAKYLDLYDNAPDMFYSVDVKTSVIINCNQTAADELGYEKEEIIGRSVLDLYTAESAEYVRSTLSPYFLKTGKIEDEELNISRKDGSKIYVSLNSSAVYNEDGEILYSRSIWRDITDRKSAEDERIKLEKKLSEAQKMKSLGILAGGIAHDFNNLLMGIVGNADLLMMEADPGSAEEENIKEILEASSRLADLANQMLAYSGKGKFVVEVIDVNEVVKKMTKLLKASMTKKIELNYTLGEDVSPVEADTTQLRQVLMNLITNASEAIDDEEGIINVITGTLDHDEACVGESLLNEDLEEDKYTFIEVTDTGCGIEKDSVNRIFDPFYSTKPSGHGLGLAAVLGIMHGHNGAIKVDSNPGEGTSFRILFPIHEPLEENVEAEPVINDDVVDLSKGGSVLLVDDEVPVLKVGSKFLEKMGFSVVTAANGVEALEMYRGQPGKIDLVILDLTMPKMGGSETFNELRKINKDVPIIICSGYSEQETTKKFSNRGLDGFIQKPYSYEKLLAAIRDIKKE